MSGPASPDDPSPVVRARKPDRRRARTRAAILGAAGELLGRQSVQLTTIEEIAAAAGMSTGTVYFHFGSKEGVVAELVQAALTALEDSLLETRDEESPVARVLAAGEHYVRFALAQPTAYQFVAQGFGDSDAPDELMAVRRDITQRIAGFRDRLRTDLALAVELGEIEVQDPATAATLLWATLNGLAALAVRDDELSIDEHAAEAALLLGREALLRAPRLA